MTDKKYVEEVLNDTADRIIEFLKKLNDEQQFLRNGLWRKSILLYLIDCGR